MECGAEISGCGLYRYALWRIWEPTRPRALFIGLNPSTADASADDPTLRRCMAFARGWGFGGVALANLFAFRSTSPRVLRQVADPVGPLNDEWLHRLRSEVDRAIAAWGNHGRLLGRAAEVAGWLPGLECLGRTVRGAPKHPLYVPGTTGLQGWTPP
jgi:hypothetical protein